MIGKAAVPTHSPGDAVGRLDEERHEPLSGRGSDPVGGTAHGDRALDGAVHAEDGCRDRAGPRLALAVRLRHAGAADLGEAVTQQTRVHDGPRRQGVEAAGQDLLLLGSRQERQDAGARPQPSS